MAWRVGVDSGGTFTDVCLFDDTTGQSPCGRCPPPPTIRPAASPTAWRRRWSGKGRHPDAVGYFGHGTTVATNALIQHRGVKTGLITTDGFRDLLEIGRQKRPDLYDLQADKPPVLVSRDLRLEVPERVRHDGTVEIPLDEAAFRAAVRQLRAAGVAAVAVCFLYGFVATEHEATARRILAEEFPEAFACVSHDVAPEFREFERLSTTVVNAYLGPVMRGYIERLGARLDAMGLHATPHLTQSNGGVIGFTQAARLPVRTVLSGPSTGVVGAQEVGRAAGLVRADHLRHGRHLHRRRAAERRRVPAGQRGDGARLSDQGADAGYPHGGRRRRLHRLCGQRRVAESRPPQRRRRSGPGVLRPRQHGTDRHRCQRDAGRAEPGVPAGRADESAPRPGPLRDLPAWPTRWAWSRWRRRRVSFPW